MDIAARHEGSYLFLERWVCRPPPKVQTVGPKFVPLCPAACLHTFGIVVVAVALPSHNDDIAT
jgi:hypothetical protein